MEKSEEIEFARKVVNDTNHSFLNKEDIVANIEEEDFLVNESSNIGFVSYMDYDRENNRGILTYTKDKNVKDQEQLLLINYCMFKSDNSNHVKYYYKDIPSKSLLKRLARYIVSASVDKEFGGDSFENIKEVKKR